MDKLRTLLQSRKFWAAAGGILAVALKAFKPDFPLSDEQLIGLVVVLGSYIVGTGLEAARPS